MSNQVPWPSPPREPGGWDGGPPVAPPGNTALPPLPGMGGVTNQSPGAGNPWAAAAGAPGAVPGAQPLPSAEGKGGGALRTILIVALIVMLLGLAGFGAYTYLNRGPTYPKAWDKRVEPIAKWVAEERELEFNHPVEVVFLSEKEYTARSTDDGSTPDKESQKELDEQVAQMRALGMVSGKVDLRAASNTLSDSGTLAFYDQHEKKVFVRGTKMTPALRVTLAHELTHVLQDQHFDLTRLDDLPDDQAPVLRSLAEGDATAIEDRYVEKVLKPAEKKEYEASSKEEGDAAQKEIDDKVPPAMTTWFAAPYILGPTMIHHLEQDGGYTTIDEAFTDVPSEEVLFDPRLYGTDAGKPEKIDLKAPDGAKSLDDGTFGATSWYLILASRVPQGTALKAASGLKGDAYVTYHKDGEKGPVCVSARAIGDNAGEAAQLGTTLGAWAKKSPAGTVTVSTKGDTVDFVACDPGEAATSGGTIAVDLLGLPVSRTQLYDQLIKQGANPKQATCYSDAVVATYTAAQLNDPKFGTSPDVQRKLAELGAACR